MDGKEGQEPRKRFFLIAWAKKFHQNNMNAVEDGNQLKDVGLKIIYFGVVAFMVEFFYTFYFMEHSLGIIERLYQYFFNVSPSFTFLGAGFACYAFGVTLVENQKIRRDNHGK